MLSKWSNIEYRKNLDDVLKPVPVVDKQALIDMGIDVRLFTELSEIYFRQTPELLRDIRNQMNIGKTECLRKLAHNLKGTSMNLGAARMAEISRMIEKSSAANSPAEVRHLITCLEKEFVETEFSMQKLCDSWRREEELAA